MRRLAVFTTVALLLAASAMGRPKSYSVSIPTQCMVGSVHLKPGEYRLRLDGPTALFSAGNSKEVAKVKVAVSTANRKFEQTEIDTSKGPDNSDRITEIKLEGTKLDLQFNQ